MIGQVSTAGHTGCEFRAGTNCPNTFNNHPVEFSFVIIYLSQVGPYR
jgi:hypothetical protein